MCLQNTLERSVDPCAISHGDKSSFFLWSERLDRAQAKRIDDPSRQMAVMERHRRWAKKKRKDSQTDGAFTRTKKKTKRGYGRGRVDRQHRWRQNFFCLCLCDGHNTLFSHCDGAIAQPQGQRLPRRSPFHDTFFPSALLRLSPPAEWPVRPSPAADVALPFLFCFPTPFLSHPLSFFVCTEKRRKKKNTKTFRWERGHA